MNPISRGLAKRMLPARRTCHPPKVADTRASEAHRRLRSTPRMASPLGQPPRCPIYRTTLWRP